MFTGDAHGETEAQVISNFGGNLKANAMNGSHHGADTHASHNTTVPVVAYLWLDRPGGLGRIVGRIASKALSGIHFWFRLWRSVQREQEAALGPGSAGG
jgi:hypothetical protein